MSQLHHSPNETDPAFTQAKQDTPLLHQPAKRTHGPFCRRPIYICSSEILDILCPSQQPFLRFLPGGGSIAFNLILGHIAIRPRPSGKSIASISPHHLAAAAAASSRLLSAAAQKGSAATACASRPPHSQPAARPFHGGSEAGPGARGCGKQAPAARRGRGSRREPPSQALPPGPPPARPAEQPSRRPRPAHPRHGLRGSRLLLARLSGRGQKRERRQRPFPQRRPRSLPGPPAPAAATAREPRGAAGARRGAEKARGAPRLPGSSPAKAARAPLPPLPPLTGEAPPPAEGEKLPSAGAGRGASPDGGEGAGRGSSASCIGVSGRGAGLLCLRRADAGRGKGRGPGRPAPLSPPRAGSPSNLRSEGSASPRRALGVWSPARRGPPGAAGCIRAGLARGPLGSESESAASAAAALARQPLGRSPPSAALTAACRGARVWPGKPLLGRRRPLNLTLRG